MAKVLRKTSKEGAHHVRKPSSPHGVVLRGDDVIVQYHSCGKNRVLKLSKASILASGRAALSKVPVMIE